jgi:sodium-coupled neutral amino acid transporter 11
MTDVRYQQLGLGPPIHTGAEDGDIGATGLENEARESLESTPKDGSSRESFDDIDDTSAALDEARLLPSTPGEPHLGQNEALEALAEQSGKSNLKMAFMNMANSIIGAGIIGQAYAIRQAGLITGTILFVVLTIVIDWTLRLMVINAKMSSTDSFQATVMKCFGKPGLITISIAQCAFAFGGSMAYCVIIGDTIPHVVNAIFPSLRTIPVVRLLVSRNAIIIICTLGISFPLALYRNIAHLAKASALALVSMLVIVLTVVIHGPAVPHPLRPLTLPLLVLNSGVFQAISVISFAFVCHHNSLLIFESLKTPTLDRFALVTHWSTGVSMVSCLTLGLGGFLVFRDETRGNVLNNFPADDTVANVARFCFGFNMLTTLPLEIFVCREVIQNYFWPSSPFQRNRHVLLTACLISSAMFVALLTCNLGAILELVGALSACTMAYILPPLCFLKLSNKPLRGRIPSYLCVAFGGSVLILSSVQTLIKLFTGSDESHCVM